MNRFLHKLIPLALALVMLVSCFASCSGSTSLLTVDGNVITEDIMNYYVYISTSMLELYYEGALDYSAEIDEFDGQTLGEVVKKLAYEQIVEDYATLMLAREYNLAFTEDEEEAVLDQVDQVIANIGPKSTYTEFLKTVNISDKTYRAMVYNQLLCQKVEAYLTADDGPLALTQEEIATATETYADQFVNVEYVLISSLDLETGDELDSTTIAQNKELAKKVRTLALNGTDFHKLIDRYSNKSVDGYSAYVEKGDSDIPSEFLSAAFDLEENEISPIINTDYGFYIIKRLPFDDYFSTVVLENARTEKMSKARVDASERMSIVTSDAYNKYEIK